MLDHIPGKEMRTKHKEAIYQLYKQAKFMSSHLTVLHYIKESSITRVLQYNQPERAQPCGTGPAYKLNNIQIN